MGWLSGFIEGGQIWTLVAAIGAMISIVYAGMPLLDRADTKERVKAVVTERRRSLAASQRDEMEAQKALIRPQHTVSQSLATLFQVERYAGLSNAREKLASAGYRSPKAALVYMISRLVTPMGMGLIGFLYTTGFDLTAAERGLIALGAAIAGFFLPGLYVYNKAQKRKQEVYENFPDALDLMLVCVEGGLGVEAAIGRVAREVEPQSEVLAEEMGLLSAELALLGDRTGAFKNFAARIREPSARTFANTLIQAEKYGTSLGRALRTLSTDLRDQRMTKAERIAAALPAKLTVPMIVFLMPSLFVTILGPAIIRVMAAF